MHRLVISSNSVAPDFKTLLFPYREGEQQPKTAWNADHTQLVVEWSDQKDAVAFAKPADGRTRIKVIRAGKEVAAVE